MARLHSPRSSASNRPSPLPRLAALVVVLCGAVATAAAQQTDHGGPAHRGERDGPEGTEWRLGLGVMAKQDAYTGIKRDTMVVPLLRVQNEYLEFAGLGLTVK